MESKARSEWLREAAGFIRPEVCAFASSLSALGCLMYGQANALPYALASTFLGTAATYSFNNMKDHAEDRLNRGRVNRLSSGRAGYAYSAALYAAGLVLAAWLTALSAAIYTVAMAAGVAYSQFRLKRHLLVKNLYTGLGIPLIFLIGAGRWGPDVAAAYALFSTFIFIGSVISDLRDYRGDKAAGVTTLPVRIGYDATRCLVLSLTAAFTAWAWADGLRILLPFTALMAYHIVADNPGWAHRITGLSLITLAAKLAL